MGKTFLIAGTWSAVTIELIQGALSRNDRVLAALDPDAEQPPIEPDWQKNLRYIPWNRRSPLSAKTFILEGTNAFERIDEALLVYAPEGAGRAIHESALAEIEETMDDDLKGLLFLLKELFAFFEKQKSGTLSCVFFDKGMENLPPLEAAVAGAFRALVPTLQRGYGNEGFLVRGFHAAADQPKEFAQYILGFSERTEKTAGRWVKYSGKTGFFSFGRKS